ncbi:hypothetical protein K7432_014888 [Basidiobolus ranarum]|uniref:Cysteine-rich transmembrane CYSTM domain-containing protein n=1 Tax=Basidiobolus ranarum TaxID=34480 RepID=A0ABR2VNV6_9FUNG
MSDTPKQPSYSPYPQAPTQSYPGDRGQRSHAPQGYYPPRPQRYPQPIYIEQSHKSDTVFNLCLGCDIGLTMCWMCDAC